MAGWTFVGTSSVAKGDTAKLTGTIEVTMSFAGMHWFENENELDIRGNVDGRVW